MAYAPSSYQALRDDHAKALEALDQHTETSQSVGPEPSVEQQAGAELSPDPEPTRPETHYGASRGGWTDMGGMVAQQKSANEYNTLIVASLEARGQDAGQETASAALSQENSPEHELGQGKGLNEGPQLDDSGVRAEMNIDDTSDKAKAWIDGVELDTSQQPDSGDLGRDAALNEIDQNVGGGESVDRGSEFRDAAQEVLDHHIDNGPVLTPDIEQQQPGIEI